MVEWKELALKHAKEEDPKESCGLVVCWKGRGKYIACRNIAPSPNHHFIIDPFDWVKAEDTGQILAVVHSHPHSSPKPSEADLKACDVINLPWHICNPNTEEWHTFNPVNWKIPLIGRNYSYGIYDCWSLVRDYYNEKGIKLRDWDRPHSLDAFEEDPLFERCYKETGFRELDDDEPLQEGDSVLFSTYKNKLNHVGVFIEPQQILHHSQGRLSSRDFYGEWLLKCTKRRLRYVA